MDLILESTEAIDRPNIGVLGRSVAAIYAATHTFGNPANQNRLKKAAL